MRSAGRLYIVILDIAVVELTPFYKAVTHNECMLHLSSNVTPFLEGVLRGPLVNPGRSSMAGHLSGPFPNRPTKSILTYGPTIFQCPDIKYF
jgi:hypothetical protein